MGGGEEHYREVALPQASAAFRSTMTCPPPHPSTLSTLPVSEGQQASAAFRTTMSRRHTDMTATAAGSSSSSVLMSLHDPDAEAFAILNQGEEDGTSQLSGEAATSGGGGGGGGGSLRSLGRVSSSVVPQSLMAFEVSGFEKVGGIKDY